MNECFITDYRFEYTKGSEHFFRKKKLEKARNAAKFEFMPTQHQIYYFPYKWSIAAWD